MYENSALKDLKRQFFRPDDQFTPIPFWFWNNVLEKDEIERQIDDFKSKGVMGFVIHPRIGLPPDIKYLSDKFMEYVEIAVEKASRNGMKVVLYDEGMYPSGSANGLVVKGNPEYASRGLRMTEYKCSGAGTVNLELSEWERLVSAIAVKKTSENAIKPGCEIILFSESGQIRNESPDSAIAAFKPPDSGEWSILLFIETFTAGTIRGIHFGEDDNEAGAPRSSDLLNPEAVEKFIQLTHERYYSVLKKHFNNTIIGMFTDEPDISGRCSKSGIISWTPGFLDWYKKLENSEIDLPALWFDTGSDIGKQRKSYAYAIRKRLEMSYYRQISTWCEEHCIALMGHPHESDEMGFLKYFTIPGQDMVWRWVAPENGKGIEGRHSTMGKCTSDTARHNGMRRNGNECFGCCGPDGLPWAFSADDMKWYLDWLFVRGVNLIIPHAFFYSLEGEKRMGERPPDVGPNSIWWKYYNHISGYIKRMCWLMTDSANTADVAVLCGEDRLPWEIVRPFYRNQIEFNYLECSDFLSCSCSIKNGTICIKSQSYKIIVIDNVELLSEDICLKLKEFFAGGGRIILFDPAAAVLPFKNEFLNDICLIKEYENVIDAVDMDGKRDIFIKPECCDLRTTHIIKNGIHFYLLVNEGNECIEGELYLKTIGKLEKWDAWNGSILDTGVQMTSEGYLTLPLKLEYRESVIFCIDSCNEDINGIQEGKLQHWNRSIDINNGWKASLFEVWKGCPEKFFLTALNSRRSFILERLGSWTRWEGMGEYSGTVEYETGFELENVGDYGKLELDLGDVRDTAHVYINGIDAGFKLWRPFRFDVTGLVKDGLNTLKIRVSNSPANWINKAMIDSGLLGQVSINFVLNRKKWVNYNKSK